MFPTRQAKKIYPVRSLSRLRALLAFEAAARHGSFVAAAAELHVTPAAIGQQVRELEAALGVPLFLRRPHGSARLVPTEDARAALKDLSEGFDNLETGLRRLRGRAARSVVVVTASHALAARWLLPELPDFAQRHPGVDVRLDVTDRLLDVAQGEADVGLRCGPGGWPGVLATHLMDEEIYPVCSPALFDGAAPATPVWLAGQILIHDTTAPAAAVFPDWPRWLGFAGVAMADAERGLRINASATVLQAAAKGQGVALARHALVAHDVAEGRLVRLFPTLCWPIPWAYYLVTGPRAARRPEVAAFRDWLAARWASRTVSPTATP
jgi:LysR family glycine cleavage system transcriptional activator